MWVWGKRGMRAGADSGFIIEIMPQGHKAQATTRRHSHCHMEITSKTGTGMGPASSGCVLWPMRHPQCKKAQMARGRGLCRAKGVRRKGQGAGSKGGRGREERKGKQHMLRSAQGTGAAVRFLRISGCCCLLWAHTRGHRGHGVQLMLMLRYL